MTIPSVLTVNRLGMAALLVTLLSGCGVTGLSTAVGPSRGAVVSAQRDANVAGLQVLRVADRVAVPEVPSVGTDFASLIGDAQPVGTVVGVGDAIEITIWEAPPALLFGAGSTDTRIGSPIAGARPGTLPETVVGPSGSITVPFAGQVPVAGRSLRQIEQSVVARLSGKANQPQVIVRIARNATANISVVGEVSNGGRQPLTPKGERVLDVIAAAGGTRHPTERMTVQLTRGDRTATMALSDVVRDPRQNVILQRDDIVTALFQPFSFTVLGATGRNEEVRFEGTGLTLSQALGRVGGLQDQRADSRGVFVFRWEPADRVRALGKTVPAGMTTVPVIYQADLRDPANYFLVQRFAVQHGDILYVANSPVIDLQRFVNILASSVLPAVSVTQAVVQ